MGGLGRFGRGGPRFFRGAVAAGPEPRFAIFHNPHSRSHGQDPYDRQTKQRADIFHGEGSDAMNARFFCGMRDSDAGRAAAITGLILAAAATVWSQEAASAADLMPLAQYASEYVITDEPDATSAIRAANPEDDLDLASALDRADRAVGGPAHEGGMVEPSGHHGPVLFHGESYGGHSYGESKGWINRILCNVGPRVVGQVDALMLWQGAIPSRPLYVSDTEPFATVLDADQAQTPVSTGTRYTLQLNLDCTYAFEGSYFSVYGFEGEHSTPHSDSGYAMDNLAGLNYGDINWARLRTNGSIQSAEFNWRRKTCTPITWLAGFRWLEWNEGLHIVDQYNGLDGLAFDRINTQTGNDMYGGQVGADVMLWNRGQDVKVNGVGKAGIFYNQAYSRTNVPTEFIPLDGDAVADQTAFFGEVGANASVKLTHWLSWRFGYSVYWLSGVATAVNQLERVGQAPPLELPRINTNGSVLLHGATTGLEARW